MKGLLGGHSGMDIDSGRGNANKWMSRLLWTISKELKIQLISFDGGGLRNAIPGNHNVLLLFQKVMQIYFIPYLKECVQPLNPSTSLLKFTSRLSAVKRLQWKMQFLIMILIKY